MSGADETPITKEEMREIVDRIAYAEAREAEQKRKEEKAKAEAEKNRMTLNKYIAMYCDQITTGATLMYLAGVDLYDIMKVTGHASPKMLKKYIKADSLEVVEKLTDKYEYFR